MHILNVQGEEQVLSEINDMCLKAQPSETDTAEKQLRLVKNLNKKLPANSAHQTDMFLMQP
jgi:hypothetical protein